MIYHSKIGVDQLDARGVTSMIHVRSESLHLVEEIVGTLQLVDYVERMDVDDSRPALRRSLIPEEESPHI